MSDELSGGRASEPDEGLDAELEREIREALGEGSVDDLMGAEEAAGEAPADADAQPIRQGKVMAVHKDDIFVDLGGRTQGVITADQFEPDKRPNVGDTVEVFVERYDDSEGLVILTRKGVAQKAAWATMARGDVVEARVTGVNKGGLECDLNGLRAFMPASQVDRVRVPDVGVFVGQKLRCQIAELDRREHNIVLSRRQLLEKEAAEVRQKTLAELAEGQVRTGTVRSIMPYGAFVDIGGLDGLLHVSDMSRARTRDPNALVKVGQEVTVKVLKIEEGGERISLGMKQLEPDPWPEAGRKYPKGSSVKGRVTNLAKFGAFVEIEPGLEALIPISEMTWKKRINHPSEILSVGGEVECQVLEVDPARNRMSVSLKAFEPDPWEGVERRYPVNSLVRGKVTRVVDFGAFIELEPGVEGLAHVSELSEKPIQRPSDAVRSGQEVQVRVIAASESDRRISLSLKSAAPEPEAGPEEPSAAAAAPKKRRKPLKGGIE